MVLYKTGSWSAADFKSEEPDRHDVINARSWSAEISLPENRITMMLYSTESLSAENFTLDVLYDYFTDIGEYCPRSDTYGRPSISQLGTYM